MPFSAIKNAKEELMPAVIEYGIMRVASALHCGPRLPEDAFHLQIFLNHKAKEESNAEE